MVSLYKSFDIMRINYLFTLGLISISTAFSQTKVFINEIHYDNVGSDVNEGVEIAGPSGTSLKPYSLIFYNGNGNTVYKNLSLTGTIPNTPTGFGFVFFEITGIQNGAPDGVALAKNGSLIQFLSYEGTITAADGVAINTTSSDIGVAESNGTTLEGYSLQLTGAGNKYEDFSWSAPTKSTYNATNTGQKFSLTASANNSKLFEIQLFPNPSNTGFIQIISNSKSPIQAKFYNTIGQLVLNVETNNQSINLESLNAGLYYVYLYQNHQHVIKKLVVE